MRTDSPGQVTLCHQAMATDFSITIAHPDTRYAHQAAAEAFLELDRLESRLSAFRAGQRCVAHRASGRRRDAVSSILRRSRVCVSRWTWNWPRAGRSTLPIASQPHRAASELIRLGDRTPMVTVLEHGVALDLGGIGKGFALDHMAAAAGRLGPALRAAACEQEYGARATSAAGAAGWEVRFGTAGARAQPDTVLRRRFSGSGSDLKGPHIIDPHAGQPATHHRLAFATAATGAEADALSTAFVVMTDDAIRDYCRHHPACRCLRCPGGSGIATGPARTAGHGDHVVFSVNVQLMSEAFHAQSITNCCWW